MLISQIKEFAKKKSLFDELQFLYTFVYEIAMRTSSHQPKIKSHCYGRVKQVCSIGVFHVTFLKIKK